MADKRKLLDTVLKARAMVSDITKTLDDAKEVKKNAEEELLQLMELLDERSFKTEEGILVTRKQTLRASVIKGKEQEALLWIDEECGRPDLIKRTVHSETFASFIGQRMKEREPVPVDMIKCYFQPGLSIRK